MLDDTALDDGSKPTRDMSDDLQLIYNRLNWRLFNSELPNCMITLKRHYGSWGFFSAEQFKREDGKYCDEIAISPRFFDPENPIRFYEKLSHEMAHLWQFHFGTPGRGRYHNREWADKMIDIGLHPTDTGDPGGRETGDTIYQIVMPEGRFSRAAEEMLSESVLLKWTESEPQKTETRIPLSWEDDESDEDREGDISGDPEDCSDPDEPIAKSGVWFKYACPHEECNQTLRAKFGAQFDCSIHKMQVVMVEPKKRRPG